LNKLNRFTPLLIVISALFTACKHELVVPNPPDIIDPGSSSGLLDSVGVGVRCSSDTVYFQNTILPLITSGCAKSKCHDVISHKEGVILTNYNNILKYVKPFKPNSSELYKVLFETGEERMPPAGQTPFTQAQKDIIKKWIEQGALNNSCNESYGGCDTTKVTYSGFINPLMVNYCVGCHSGSNPDGGINLSSYVYVKTQAVSGKLYGSVSHSPGYIKMPSNGPKLQSCYLNKIKAWISLGMPQ
jgi:hypothetical protein